MKNLNSEQQVFLALCSTANTTLSTALSRVGENVSPEAREELHKAIEALYQADRLVRFGKRIG